jgi:gliding motility-associated lipoprotein GldJ
MQKLHSILFLSSVVLISAVILSSCSGSGSGATGWAYNDSENGGFQQLPYLGQETGPGLVFVEGGTFTMGQVEDDLTGSWDNIPRRVTVSSFYMDEVEVTNYYWLEYLFWLNRVYGEGYPEVVQRAKPDTLVWRDPRAYNEPYVNYYLRHPAFRDYPVVGVSWLQANDFCKWRTDRVNEQIMVREGFLVHNPTGQVDDSYFSTETYLDGQYEEAAKAADGIKDLRPNGVGYRNVSMSDGILLPDYRLPTEAEWEYAALSLIGNSGEELITSRRTYPWDGHYVRNDDSRGKFYGEINANFVRARGDYMGVAGALNDNADVTAPVYSYAPNDYGLYNMAGNVSEWVMDVYRPGTHQDAQEFRPFRGNVFSTKLLNSEGNVTDKLDYVEYDIDAVEEDLTTYEEETAGRLTSEGQNLIDNLKSKMESANEDMDVKRIEEAMTKMDEALDLIEESEAPSASDLRKFWTRNIINTPGQMRYRKVTVEENLGRRNYQQADNIDYLDGDLESSIFFDQQDDGDDLVYDYGETSLVNDNVRVYKGGSWNDRVYWIIPGTRRFLEENQSSSTIGFRCAMTRVGSPSGNAMGNN